MKIDFESVVESAIRFVGAVKLIQLRLKKNDIYKHNVFPFLINHIHNKIPNLVLEDKNREIICKRFLEIKFNAFLSTLKEIKKDDYDKLSENELYEYMLKNLQKATEKYENEARQIGLPDIFLDSFKKWHEPHVELVVKGMEQICLSFYNKNNKLKIMSIFDFYIVGFHFTYLDAGKTFNSLNGKLSKWIQENQQVIFKCSL